MFVRRRCLPAPLTRCRRFLRARKFDLAKAKIMWIDTQKWRQAYKVDELYETFDYTEKAQVSKLYPRFYHKTDKVRPRARVPR